ncbi:MAG: MFS transporter [Novosphingobium sp.]
MAPPLSDNSPPSYWQAARTEWRGHWQVGLTAMIGTALSFSVWSSVASIFVQPLQDAFGWTRGQIALTQNASFAGALAAPMVGRLIDRVGVRIVLLGALVLTVLAYGALAAMNGALPVFYAAYLFLTLAGLGTTGLSYTRIVSAAFVRTRGLALAVTRSGLAIAGAVLPSALFMLITHHGWRAGYLLLAGLILFVSLPLAWVFIGRGPAIARVQPRAAMRLRDVLADRKVLIICLASGLNYAPVVALLSQLQPLLVSKGVPPGNSAALVGLVGLAALGGTFITGALVDRIWAPGVACLFTLLAALGCLLLGLPGGGMPAAMAAIVLIGIGQGAEIDVVAFIIARWFGMERYSTIYGLSVFAIAMLVALGGSLVGIIYDRTGSYNAVLIGAAVCFGLSALAYLAMGKAPILDPAFDKKHST